METSNPRENLTAFQLGLLVMSILVLGALIVDAVAPISSEVSRIVQTLDLAACLLFFADFLWRLRRAPNKAAFMRWGWVDLAACIPNVDALRVGRLIRVLRIVRLLRGVRVGHRVVSLILQNKPKSAFASVLLTTVLLVAFTSIAILIAEEGSAEANIRSAEDAIWWSMSTMTTVGYGDRYPTTTEGRVIAMALMFAGVGLFGTLSGIVASLFIGTHEEESEDLKQILRRLEAIDAKLGAKEEKAQI
ncbi:MAG: ion transporter [Verrucomicrobiota bacterium]